MIVLPGLVETHWHMWNTLFRSLAGEKPDRGYFPTVATLGAAMTPEDMYHGVRLATAEAIDSGMTTVHNYCHKERSNEHASADYSGLKATVLRESVAYEWQQGQPVKLI